MLKALLDEIQKLMDASGIEGKIEADAAGGLMIELTGPKTLDNLAFVSKAMGACPVNMLLSSRFMRVGQDCFAVLGALPLPDEPIKATQLADTLKN